MVLDVTAKLAVLLLVAAMDKLLGVTIKTGKPAACVTVMVSSVTPFAETVTVAVLLPVVGFAVAVKPTVSSLKPLEGLALNHA